MQYLVTLLLAFFFSSISSQLLAQEHRLSVQFRTDFEINSSNHERDENNETRSTQFTLARSIVGFNGDLNKKTSYSTALSLNSSFDRDNFDSSSPGVKSWYVDRKLTDKLTLRVGKQFVTVGAWENNYSGMDQYFYSYLSNNLPAYFSVGASLKAKYFGQTFNVQLLNSSFKQNNQGLTGLNFNLIWYGDFLKGALKPIISFGVFPSTEQKDATGETVRDSFRTTVISTGFQVNFYKVSIDLESGRSSTPEYVENTDEGDIPIPPKAITNVVFQVKYRPKYIHPFFKFAVDDVRSGNEEITGEVIGYTQMALGAEYLPDDAINTMRYHAVFISGTERPDEGFNVTSAQINVGAAFRF